MRTGTLRGLALPAALVTCALSGYANTLTYFNNRVAFQTATGTGGIGVTFEGFTSSALFVNNPPGFTNSGLNFSIQNQPVNGSRMFLMDSSAGYSSGTDLLSIQGANSGMAENVLITLPLPGCLNFGLDFNSFRFNEAIQFSVYDSSGLVGTQSAIGSGANPSIPMSFWGVSATAPITAIRIDILTTHTDGFSTGFNIDNVTCCNTLGNVSTPEPATWTLALAPLSALLLRRLRR